jgi:hypothetical protein
VACSQVVEQQVDWRFTLPVVISMSPNDANYLCERFEYAGRVLQRAIEEAFRRMYVQHRSLDGMAELHGRALLEEILALEPATDEGKQYRTLNAALISSDANGLCQSRELVAACSCLYAVQIMHWNFLMGRAAAHRELPKVIDNRPMALVTRASLLSFHIPNAYEICRSEDPVVCLEALCRLADEFAKQYSSRKA